MRALLLVLLLSACAPQVTHLGPIKSSLVARQLQGYLTFSGLVPLSAAARDLGVTERQLAAVTWGRPWIGVTLIPRQTSPVKDPFLYLKTEETEVL